MLPPPVPISLSHLPPSLDHNPSVCLLPDPPQINTNVYVTGLPLDVTLVEVAETFGKCGVIKVDEKGQPRIKLYRCVEGARAVVTFMIMEEVKAGVGRVNGAGLRE